MRPSLCALHMQGGRRTFCEPAQQEESSECLLVHAPLCKPAVPFAQVRALIPRPREPSGSYLRPVRRSNWSFQFSPALIPSGLADKIGAVNRPDFNLFCVRSVRNPCLRRGQGCFESLRKKGWAERVSHSA